MEGAEVGQSNGRSVVSAPKEEPVSDVASSAVKPEESTPAENSNDVTALSVQPSNTVELSGYVGNRPVGPAQMEVYENFSVAGLRPIAAGKLEVYGTILNNRPIEASHLQVLDDAQPGQRPVFATELLVRDDLTLPGGRPIVASDPRLLEASLLPGGRPIASNAIANETGDALMGFLD
ncbi:MAG: hypothetical protein Fur0046_20970 [Cyanobacteria bacterium J069]|nr:MAG: hypothetical protein D6742_00160 [Cyanobacteria bacterium J069]